MIPEQPQQHQLGLSEYVSVYNMDFDRWRDKHHKGGDFIVFSDVFWQPPPPDSRTIIEL